MFGGLKVSPFFTNAGFDFTHTRITFVFYMAKSQWRLQALTGVAAELVNGCPTGKSSGSGTNSEIHFQSCVKSLFTSPERQSVISPAASGYFLMTLPKEKSGL